MFNPNRSSTWLCIGTSFSKIFFIFDIESSTLYDLATQVAYKLIVP